MEKKIIVYPSTSTQCIDVERDVTVGFIFVTLLHVLWR